MQCFNPTCIDIYLKRLNMYLNISQNEFYCSLVIIWSCHRFLINHFNISHFLCNSSSFFYINQLYLFLKDSCPHWDWLDSFWGASRNRSLRAWTSVWERAASVIAVWCLGKSGGPTHHEPSMETAAWYFSWGRADSQCLREEIRRMEVLYISKIFIPSCV